MPTLEASSKSKFERTTVGIEYQPVRRAGPTPTAAWNGFDDVRSNPTRWSVSFAETGPPFFEFLVDLPPQNSTLGQIQKLLVFGRSSEVLRPQR